MTINDDQISNRSSKHEDKKKEEEEEEEEERESTGAPKMTTVVTATPPPTHRAATRGRNETATPSSSKVKLFSLPPTAGPYSGCDEKVPAPPPPTTTTTTTTTHMVTKDAFTTSAPAPATFDSVEAKKPPSAVPWTNASTVTTNPKKGLSGNRGPNATPGAVAVTGGGGGGGDSTNRVAFRTTTTTTAAATAANPNKKGLSGNSGPNTPPGAVAVGVDATNRNVEAMPSSPPKTTTDIITNGNTTNPKKGLSSNSGPNAKPGAVSVGISTSETTATNKKGLSCNSSPNTTPRALGINILDAVLDSPTPTPATNKVGLKQVTSTSFPGDNPSEGRAFRKNPMAVASDSDGNERLGNNSAKNKAAEPCAVLLSTASVSGAIIYGLRQANDAIGQSPQVGAVSTSSTDPTPKTKKGLCANSTQKKIASAATSSLPASSPDATNTTTMPTLRGIRKSQGPNGASRTATSPVRPVVSPPLTLCGLANNKPPKTKREKLAVGVNEPETDHVVAPNGGDAEDEIAPSLADPSPAVVEDPAPNSPPAANLLPALQTDDFGLAVARPIKENSVVIIEAQEVRREELEKKETEEKKRKECKMVGCTIVAVCAIILGLCLGFTLGNKKDSPPLPPPTLPPTKAPSESPSVAPSSAFDLLLDSLPEYTRTSLENADSPQWKAMDWLSRHPNITGHPNTTHPEEWRKRQLFAVATFYYSFLGEKWNKVIQERWMDYEKEECLWFSSGLGYFDEDGLYVDQDARLLSEPCNDAGEFVALHMENLQLSGFVPTMPPEIALLTSLSILSLALNDINASVSDMMIPELFQLNNITQLVFGHNALSGTIPTELGLMSGIEVLGLDSNKLIGSIPTQLALLNNMILLWLGSNALNGSIPTQFALMTNMDVLALYNNQLAGPIPTELGLMTNMEALRLANNALTGAIPTELVLLSNMTYLSLSTNHLTGQIPTQLGVMSNLVDLGLFRNALGGPLPSELARMTNMTKLSLSTNSLSGTIPTELALLGNTTKLMLYKNQLTGIIPSQLALMTNTRMLYLWGNTLTGGVPTQLGMLTNLEMLSLSNNFLTGTIHNSIWSLKNMTRFYLRSNNLSGTISTEVGLMSNLLSLSLEFNSLSASIPIEVGLLTNLRWALFHNNSLTGPLPKELELLAMNGSLGLLTLENNDLTGIVPEGACSLNQYNDTLGFGLSFDCTRQLCGCDWCLCGSGSSSNGSLALGVNGTR